MSSKSHPKRDKVIGGIKNILSRTKDDFKSGSQELRSEFKDLLQTAKASAKTVAKRASKSRTVSDYSHINYNAGGKILAHFQQQWAEMHESTAENSVLATSLNRKLQELAKTCKDRHNTVEEFYREFQGLPALLKSVEQARENVAEIGTTIEKVEQSLNELEYSCALLENARKKGVMRVRHEGFIQEKEEEVGKLQKQVNAEKELIDQKNEEINMGSARERQQTFEDMFNQQVTEYKSKGRLERPISMGSDTIVFERLGDIEIDDVDGKQSLSEFLDDVTSKNGDDESVNTNVSPPSLTDEEKPSVFNVDETPDNVATEIPDNDINEIPDNDINEAPDNDAPKDN